MSPSGHTCPSFIGSVTAKFREQGVFAAISTISALFEYGGLIQKAKVKARQDAEAEAEKVTNPPGPASQLFIVAPLSTAARDILKEFGTWLELDAAFDNGPGVLKTCRADAALHEYIIRLSEELAFIKTKVHFMFTLVFLANRIKVFDTIIQCVSSTGYGIGNRSVEFPPVPHI